MKRESAHDAEDGRVRSSHTADGAGRTFSYPLKLERLPLADNVLCLNNDLKTLLIVQADRAIVRSEPDSGGVESGEYLAIVWNIYRCAGELFDGPFVSCDAALDSLKKRGFEIADQ